MKLNRTREQWEKSVPMEMAKMSAAAIMYALEDARHDLLMMHAEIERCVELAKENEKLRGEIRVLRGSHDWLSHEKERLESAIQRTLDENGHLADGENCTLIHLVRAMPCQVSDSKVLMSVGDTLKIPKGTIVTLCRGYGKYGMYFFSHKVEGREIVYGGVTYDTPDDVASGSKRLLGVAVQVVSQAGRRVERKIENGKI